MYVGGKKKKLFCIICQKVDAQMSHSGFGSNLKIYVQLSVLAFKSTTRALTAESNRDTSYVLILRGVDNCDWTGVTEERPVM